jgi:hypothetical protein
MRGRDAGTEALRDAPVFTEKRERLIAGDIAARFMVGCPAFC